MLATALQLADRFGVTVAIIPRLPVPLWGVGWSIAASALLLLAFALLAARLPDVAGHSAGRVLLIVWAAGPLGSGLITGLLGTGVPSAIGVAVGTTLQVGLPLAGLLASALVVRARVLSRPARWSLLATTVLQVVEMVVLLAAPSLFVLVFLLIPSSYLEPALLLVCGVALVAYGSSRRAPPAQEGSARNVPRE